MSDALIVPPGSDANGGSESTSQDQQRRDEQRAAGKAIPSREDCLRAIAALAGLVAMGILKPAQANSIRASYEAVLRQHDRDRDRAGHTAQLPSENVLKVFDQHPELIDLMTPLLSTDQLMTLVNRTKDQPGGQD